VKRPALPAVRIASGLALAALAGCGHLKKRGTPSASSAAASAAPSASAGLVDAIPVPHKTVQQAVDRSGAPPYSGPTGSVQGVITAVGDPPPDRPEVLAKIPPKCAAASGFYNKLFREGPGRTLADAMVAVTGYHGFVPATERVKLVTGRDCAWQARTIALTFGQRLDVRSRGDKPYMPELLGGPTGVQMVAVPGGSPIQLYPERPGHYLLADRVFHFMAADVLVVKYPTFSVTGLDGKFEIDRIPVGKVTVTAFLPATMQHAAQSVVVKVGQTTTVNLAIPYHAAPDAGPKPAASSAKR
jgi:hypothetical protein